MIAVQARGRRDALQVAAGPGSVSPIPVRRCPLASSGRYAFFCSSVPNRPIIQQDSEWLPIMPATPIQPREISSNTTASETMSAAIPPYSSGTSSPKSPIWAIVATISSGYRPASSHSLATGRISESTNDRMVSRSSRCSSDRSKSMRAPVRTRHEISLRS